MKNNSEIKTRHITGTNTEKILAAVRERIKRIPYISKKKCYKVFVMNLILDSGLEYGEVMTFLNSLNVYKENCKNWKKVRPNMSIEEKFDILGWEDVVKNLIELASSDSKSIAA